jgi:hypothetical protein
MKRPATVALRQAGDLRRRRFLSRTVAGSAAMLGMGLAPRMRRAQDKPIRIGASMPLTGRYTREAIYCVDGYKLWAKHINEMGYSFGNELCSAFIRFLGVNLLIAVHGMIGGWSRSSRSQCNSSQTQPGSQSLCSDRPGRFRLRSFSFVGSLRYSKSAVFNRGG